MRIRYRGAQKDHGWKDMVDTGNPVTNTGHNRSTGFLATTEYGVDVRCEGTANLTRQSSYLIDVELDDEEILAIFRARFGANKTVARIIAESVEQRIIASDTEAPTPKRILRITAS
ncbi:hypothetical protein [Falsiroseomonas oryzae]|uniref:hypothetical protein n=1 Tax=Falsiroseomonas oryzae TaxID=2766473 RepID=UPI0022EA8943|nr:hypothetical protein [Roseomonas sp. MO-31]